jgi:hypothetical protein
MKLLLTLLGAWSIGDALWLAFAPRRWAAWWGHWLQEIGQGTLAPRITAAVEIAVGIGFIWLAQRYTPAREQTASPPAIPHHP